MTESSPLDVAAVRRDHELIEALRTRAAVPPDDVAARLLAALAAEAQLGFGAHDSVDELDASFDADPYAPGAYDGAYGEPYAPERGAVAAAGLGERDDDGAAEGGRLVELDPGRRRHSRRLRRAAIGGVAALAILSTTGVAAAVTDAPALSPFKRAVEKVTQSHVEKQQSRLKDASEALERGDEEKARELVRKVRESERGRLTDRKVDEELRKLEQALAKGNKPAGVGRGENPPSTPPGAGGAPAPGSVSSAEPGPPNGNPSSPGNGNGNGNGPAPGSGATPKEKPTTGGGGQQTPGKSKATKPPKDDEKGKKKKPATGGTAATTGPTTGPTTVPGAGGGGNGGSRRG